MLPETLLVLDLGHRQPNGHCKIAMFGFRGSVAPASQLVEDAALNEEAGMAPSNPGGDEARFGRANRFHVSTLAW